MNSNWRNRPTTIDEIPTSIDWLIAIDESGSSDLSQVIKAKKSGEELNDGIKQFTVTACALRMKDFCSARDMVMTLKNKYWKNALFEYKGVEKRICFHSKEIRGRRDAFNPDIINYDSFITDLSQLMADVPITLFSANIDKWKHVNHYSYPDNPYNLCLDFVLERLMWQMSSTENCYIILESRGRKEDKVLLNKIKYLLDNGNNYNPASNFSNIAGVYFNPKWCHVSNDKMSYWELELADLCAFPIHKYLAYGTEDEAFKVLKPKIFGYPNITGKGLKTFP